MNQPNYESVVEIAGTKLLVVGDCHIDSQTPSSRIDDFPQACLMKLQAIHDIAEQHKVTLVVFLGDMFHRKPGAPVSMSFMNDVQEVLGSFKDIGCFVYVVVGNHCISYDRVS